MLVPSRAGTERREAKDVLRRLLRLPAPWNHDFSWPSLLLSLAIGLVLAGQPLTQAALLVTATVVVLASLIRPEICLYLLAMAVPFGGILQLPVGEWRITAVEVLAALLLLVWLAQGVARRLIFLYPAPLNWPLALLLAAFLISLFDAWSYSASAGELAKWLEIAVVYLVGTSLLAATQATSEAALSGQRPSVAARLVIVLLMAGTLEALYGLYTALQRVGPPSYAILGGLVYRASGDFAQPNPFGGYMNHVWPLAAGLLAYAPWLLPCERYGATSRILAYLGLPLALALCLGSLVLSWSRGAWLGAMIAFAAMVVAWTATLLTAGEATKRMWGRRALAALLIGSMFLLSIGILGAAELLPPVIAERLVSITEGLEIVDVRTVKVTDANFATVERLAHWWAGWHMWEDYPWTGVGIGNYPVAYGRYNLPGWEDPLGHAHNVYINMGAETGVLGLAAYLIFLLAALIQTARALAKAHCAWLRGTALGILGIIMARIVQDGLDNLWVHGMGIQMALLLALASSMPLTDKGFSAMLVPTANSAGSFHNPMLLIKRKYVTKDRLEQAAGIALERLRLYWEWFLARMPLAARIVMLLQAQPRFLKQFIKFSLVGASGSVVDFGTLVTLKEFLGFNLYVANTISFTAAVCNNFLWNSLWTFRGAYTGRKRRRFLPFVLVSVIGLGLNQSILFVFHEYTGLEAYQYGYLVAKAIATIAVMLWNFLANKYWTFRWEW